MPRDVPTWMLDQILGDQRVKQTKKNKDGSLSKVKTKKKSTQVREGRKDPGMKNPRRGGYMDTGVREQMAARPGGMPQGPERNIIQQIMNEKSAGMENRQTFDKNDPRVMQNLLASTMDEVGRNRFNSMPPQEAAEMLGMKLNLDQNSLRKYEALKPTQRSTFWNRFIKNPNAPAGELLSNTKSEDGKITRLDQLESSTDDVEEDDE